jgi:hypothetical protein
VCCSSSLYAVSLGLDSAGVASSVLSLSIRVRFGDNSCVDKASRFLYCNSAGRDFYANRGTLGLFP